MQLGGDFGNSGVNKKPFNVTTAGRGMGEVKPISSFNPYTPPAPAPVGSWRTPPTYTPPPAPYNPPAYSAPVQQQYNYAPAQQSAPQTPSFGIGAPSGGGMGGAPAPAPQVKPVISDKDWLAGDSTYQNQLSEYDSSLKAFLSRLATQKNDFQKDYNVSREGWQQNKDNGLLSLGEDFTNRGLANSGLFIKAGDQATANYDRQGTALDTARTRALSDFGNQETDKRVATTKAQQNARTASLGRMASDQMFK